MREAVYRSREKQAATAALSAARTQADEEGQCGLGERAVVALELSERGAGLFAQLWPAGLGHSGLPRVQDSVAHWVKAQDGLDRKRNHFLRDYRGTHGSDREAYSPEQLAAYEQGLAAVNEEVEQELTKAALDLLGSGRSRG